MKDLVILCYDPNSRTFQFVGDTRIYDGEMKVHQVCQRLTDIVSNDCQPYWVKNNTKGEEGMKYCVKLMQNNQEIDLEFDGQASRAAVVAGLLNVYNQVEALVWDDEEGNKWEKETG